MQHNHGEQGVKQHPTGTKGTRAPSNQEIKKHLKKQLVPYVELFGPGAVIYWFGHIDEYAQADDIQFLSAEFFDVIDQTDGAPSSQD